jgi:alkyldihydroxyacetonephosphate synthase
MSSKAAADVGPTLSRLPTRRFWGWGSLDDRLTSEEERTTDALAAQLSGGDAKLLPEPRHEDFELRRPRIAPPATLAERFSSATHDRLVHAYGKSYPDLARMWHRHVPQPPDWVAFPESEEEIGRILEWAAASNIAIVPFGAGSSVCGGVETAVGDSYAGVVSLDLERFDRVLAVDHESRAAQIAGGALGPSVEAQLKPHGLTLRHFPQSFQYSTLGGWVATRAGGHFATLYTHIDDLVQATRTVTPSGVLETRRLPGSGAGPAPDRLMVGSEGTLGIITSAWLRLQAKPRFRSSASVRFKDMRAAAAAARALAQSGLYPTNCRVLDPAEVAFFGVGDGSAAVLVLAFESADHPLDAWMARALELAADYGGQWDAEAVARSLEGASENDGEHRKGAAGAWRNAFIRMPFWRDRLIGAGIIFDTFETAVTWSSFAQFYDGVRAEVRDAIRRSTGQDAVISCRFTHVYPDGPAPYFSYAVLGTRTGDMAEAISKWRDIKSVCNDVVTRLGGTVTHHHAVGRDHRPGYEAEVPGLFRAALAAAKARLDPAGILNPGVLIDPVGRTVGLTGAMQSA